MQKSKNIARIKAIDQKNLQRLLEVNPNLDDGSGIYFLTRVQTDTGIKFSYVGQAIHIKQRMLGHMRGYQHIDLSIKKHGLYSESNPDGWKINFKHFPPEKLDEMERKYIIMYAKEGYQSRNKDTGGGSGKEEIGERKPPKGYRQGIQAGKKSLARDLRGIIDKHLDVQLKPEKKNNKVSQKQEKKFWEMLDEGSYE